ncbi:MAG: hypothetical protein M1812_006074 [Candelaria pacifica]|nr:MAG: hypothetical protein M1812_006074 [Candelaria pacifica]
MGVPVRIFKGLSKFMTSGAPSIAITGKEGFTGLGGSLLVVKSTCYKPWDPVQSSLSRWSEIFNEKGDVVIAETTLKPGDPAITVAGTQISFRKYGLVIGSRTFALPLVSDDLGPAVVADQALEFEPGGVVMVGSLRLTPGAPVITIFGTTVSLGFGKLVVAKTISLLGSGGEASTSQTPTTDGGEAITTDTAGSPIFNNETVKPGSGSRFTGIATLISAVNPPGFSFHGTSIVEGEQGITINGLLVSLGPSGLIVGPKTIPIPGQNIFTVAEHIFTVDPAGFKVDGGTLKPGGSGITLTERLYH